MELVNNKETLYALIQKVKEGCTDFITNFFIDQDKINALITKKRIFFIDSPEGVLFFRKDSDFYHVYFCTCALDNLRNLFFKNIPNQVCTIDLIGKFEDVASIINILSEVGFTQYNCLERFTRINSADSDYYSPGDEVEIATELYTNLIAEMMQNNFDKYSEQLYTVEEIKNLIVGRKVLIIKDGPILKRVFNQEYFTWLISSE